MFDTLKKWWAGLGSSQPSDSPLIRFHPERLEKLYIPDNIWFRGIEMLLPIGIKGLEGAVLFYGYISQLNEGVITSVVLPKQINKQGYYEISPESMSEVARKIIGPFRMMILAQLHLHPGNFTDMSSVDQRNAANVSILGGLQFIVPQYGQVEPFKNLAVHERTRSSWRKWDKEEKDSRIVLLPTAIDLRTTRNRRNDYEF